MNNVNQLASSVNDDDREMQFDSSNGGEDGEYNSLSFVELASISVMRDDLFPWYITISQRISSDASQLDSCGIAEADGPK